ncbi:MAG: hypothetical protein ACFB21_06720 [Opitutales bacterium]
MTLTKLWILAALAGSTVCAATDRPAYLNPVDVAVGDLSQIAYVALAGTEQIAVLDLHATDPVWGFYDVFGTPTGLATSTLGALAVTLGDTEGELVLLDGHGAVSWRAEAGFSPVSPVFVDRGDALAVCNRFLGEVSFYRRSDGAPLGRVPAGREPIAAVTDPEGRFLFVGTHMPSQPATAERIGLTVEVIDAVERAHLKTLDLPVGSTGLRDLAISPDGKWVFVTHVIGHFQLPTNQLERGWMNTNAVTVIDAEAQEILGTALLDDTTLGAANPSGVGVSADGQWLAVTHSGLHEMSRVPLPALIEELRSARAVEGDDYSSGHDLTLMTRVGRKRIPLPGEGPRSLAMSGSHALVCVYFSGQLTVVDCGEADVGRIRPRVIPLGEEPPMDQIRRGELRFADARLCFQGWQSCISCHPSVRNDGLNWDLLNDGIGNPKQTKSLLFSHATPPAMAHGVRAKAEVAVRAGVRFIQFAEVDEVDAEAMDAYLTNLRPLPSPHLVDGELSELARHGKAIYDRVGCASCHSGPYFTDMALHRISHADGLARGRGFDTPTLREIWRTGPYLYDGRATSIEEALRIKDRGVDELTDVEMAALVEYVKSL